ncbi:hypothetical protein JXB01_00430 [Candidatus Micrarchaeota archaeon]|nr:hypothetical protein [Candidatus Micrarchaeota archaeon]
MPVKSCERCGSQSDKMEKCNYCGKVLCYQCIKSQKRVGKTRRYFICKSCWSSMKSRKAFKSA